MQFSPCFLKKHRPELSWCICVSKARKHELHISGCRAWNKIVNLDIRSLTMNVELDREQAFYKICLGEQLPNVVWVFCEDAQDRKKINVAKLALSNLG